MNAAWIKQSIYSAFVKAAEQYPQNIALVDHQTGLTYAQLLQQVNQYAAALMKIGNDHRTPIAIWLPNDYRFIICMLAVNSLGSAYLPLDYSFPQKRNLEILSHSGVKTFIGTSPVPDIDSSIQYIDIAELTSAARDDGYMSIATKDDLSYIIYTSGSTGRPKGVYQNQQNTLHDVMQYIQTVALNSTDRCTLFYSPAVNGAIRDIYGSLLSGAALYMANLKAEGISAIGQFLKKHRISIYHSLPGIFRAFLSLEKDVFNAVRLVYLAGDRILTSDFELFKRFFSSSAQLYAGIGSTENATIYCQWLLNHTSIVNQLLLPLGYPVPDRQFKLIDNSGQPVPDGQEGEIVVTSKYMALGYWNDPKLSEHAFAAHADGSRTFKTGDMGMIQENGMLYFLGRADKQVKIDGFRVEVDEVSEKIRQVTGVKDTCVTVHAVQGNYKLIAFLVLEDQSLTTSRIKARLREVMPSHMVPASLIILPEMPLLDNFKVDYQQLKDIYQQKIASEVTGQEDDVKSLLKNIWLKYIDNPSDFDTDRSFYDSGGSSVDIVYMAVEAEKQFKIEIPPQQIHSSLKPSVLLKLIMGYVEKEKVKADAIPYKIYLFCPFDGLSINQINLTKKLASDYETIIIQYPDNVLRASENMLSRCADIIIERYFSNPVPNAVYLGICNGNFLAQSVAAKLPAMRKPVVHINIDSSIPSLGSISLKRRISNLGHKINAYGFNDVLGKAIIARLGRLKSLSPETYIKAVAGVKRWFRLGSSVADFYIITETENLPATHIPLLFFAGTESAQSGVNNNYGWNDKYSKVEIVTLPYAHADIIASNQSQDFLIASIKNYLCQLLLQNDSGNNNAYLHMAPKPNQLQLN